MNITIRLVPLFAAAVLTACAVGPDFKRPDAPTTTAYVKNPRADLSAPAADSAQHITFGQAPPNEWWTLFQSEELNKLMQKAVSDNLTLAAARASLAQSQELLAAQRGTQLPQVELNGGNGRQKLGAQFLGPFQIPPFTYYSIGAGVRYTLDYTGGVARSVEQRAALAEFQKNELSAAYLSLTGNVAMQFLTIASARAQIQAVEELLNEDRSNVDLVKSAFEAGAVTRLDVLAAQSQLAQDETLLPPLRQQLAVARHALAILLGQAPAAGPDTELDWNQIQLPRDLPVTLPSELVHRRPDILAAEAQLHASTAEVGIATANLYPQITLTATGSQQALTTDRLFNGSNFAWSLIGGLTAPLFDGGTLRAERRASIQALHAAAANYQQTVLQSFGQIADLLEALNHDGELLSAQSNALDSARSSVDLARQSYREGNVGVLQVLDAERQSQQARLGFLRAQAQRYIDTAQLLLAMGGSAPQAKDSAGPKTVAAN
jgi:NodT family efflux transporter outer membrane factor (OMF) lipoprotein